MKLVQDLPEIFEEFGEKKREAFLEIKEYKDKGIPVIGMYCAYFPTELAMAAGAIPVGLCSFSNETITAAERDLPKSMCPLVKSSYGFAISDRCPFFHFADLVIGETTCDGKKKMYELMSEFKPVHVMELPNSQSERGLAFWKSEIIRTKEYLEEFFHIVITEEMIRDAVHLNNEIRMSLKNLCELMKLDPAPVKGEDIQKMVQGSKYRFDFATTPGVVKEVIDKIMAENGKDIAAEQKKSEKITQERDSYKLKSESLETQVNDANAEIQKFKDMDIDGIKQAADDWKTKAEKAKSDADAQISEMKFDYALTAALTGAKARNSKAVKALLDMDGLKLNDGKIIGLDEQLSQIKEENSFLFESDEPAPTIVKGTNGGSGGIGGKKPSEMTYSELCDYMEQNPGAEI